MTSQRGQIQRVSVREYKREGNRSWGEGWGERRSRKEEGTQEEDEEKGGNVCNMGRKREGREVNRQAVMQQQRFR